MSASQKLYHLNLTELLNLFCSIVQFISLDCVSIVLVQHGNNFLVITEFYKKHAL